MLFLKLTGKKGMSSFVQNMWRRNLLPTHVLMSEIFSVIWSMLLTIKTCITYWKCLQRVLTCLLLCQQV